jgi:hypothetical protein
LRAAKTIVAVGCEIDVVAARAKKIHELLRRLRIILDYENAAARTGHDCDLRSFSDGLHPSMIYTIEILTYVSEINSLVI